MDQNDDNDKAAPTTTRSRRTTPSRRRKQTVSYREAEDDTDDSDAEMEEEDQPKTAKRAAATTTSNSPRKRLGRPPKKQPTKDGDDTKPSPVAAAPGKKKSGGKADLICPLGCGKLFSIRSGLNYHVDHKVCQKVRNKRSEIEKPVAAATNKNKISTPQSIKRPRSTTKTPANAKETKAESNDDGDDDDDDDDDEKEDRQTNNKGTSPRKRRSPARNNKRAKTDSSSSVVVAAAMQMESDGEASGGDDNNDKRIDPCPHCSKGFSSKFGLDYHVDNYVCRKDQQPKGARKPIKAKADDDDDDGDDDGDYSSPNDDDEEEEEEVSVESEEDDDESDAEKSRPRRASKARSSPATQKLDDKIDNNSNISNENENKDGNDGNGDKEDSAETKPSKRVCQHCSRTFASGTGLKYHLAKNVCQNIMTASSERARAKMEKKTDKTSGRGKLEKRICPTCDRVFTSIYGLQYHVSKKVCEQVGSKHNSALGNVPLATLEPGTEFVTKWGAVRVVSDNRVTPTGVPPGSSSEDVRLRKLRVTRVADKRREEYRTVTAHSVVRRKRLGDLFGHQQEQAPRSSSRTTQKGVMLAYFGTLDLKAANDRDFPSLTPPPFDPDPMEPDGSCPERIVECILIPDRRTFFDCHMVDEDESRTFAYVEREQGAENKEGSPTKLYLQRRILMDRYFPDGLVYLCSRCAKSMTSLPGAKYHANLPSCKRKKESINPQLAYTDAMGRMDKRVEKLLGQQGGLMTLRAVTDAEMEHSVASATAARAAPPKPRPRTTARATTPPKRKVVPQHRRDRRKQAGTAPGIKKVWKAKKKKVLAYYPQVWRSLGFKVLPRKRDAPRVSYFEDRAKKKVVEQCSMRVENIKGGEHLDNTIITMREKLAELREPELGAFYPQVWKYLCFRKPRADKNLESPPDSPRRSLSPEHEVFIPQPPPFSYPAATIIDVSVLASEIDSQRYPSFARNEVFADPEIDLHADVCYMCKDERGVLFKCDFCLNCNHIECLRSRFIVKDPEPHDDFMCNKCIQGLLQKRRRAEKRRLESSIKLGGYQPQPMTGITLPANKPEPGKEMEFLAVQAQSIEEILELVKDSQSRLQQQVETAKMNDFRRSMFTNP